jgi:putative oxidoreductase
MSKGKKIALWIVSGLLTALFLFAGGTKLLMPAQTKTMFAQYGYSGWFAMFIGTCEMLGALGLLLPRLAALAATGLSIIMVGAIVTLVTHRQSMQAITPIVVLLLLVSVCYTRLKEGKTAAS